MSALPLRISDARPWWVYSRLLVPSLVLFATCIWAMARYPGVEVIPFHIMWIGLALAYCIEPWPSRPTYVLMAILSILSGAILVMRAAEGEIAWEELWEIPLMTVLDGLVIWNVQHREVNKRRALEFATREREAAERRTRMARITSHEMRAPLTIAHGYVTLLLAQAEEGGPSAENHEQYVADLRIVEDELSRTARAVERVVRTVWLREYLPRATVDVDELLNDVAERWSILADRRWEVETHGGTISASTERLRACLDTLVENAVRHTEPHDTIRLSSFRIQGDVWLGVADSGPGLAPELAEQINAGQPVDVETSHPSQNKRQTGLGLRLVQEILEPRGGRLIATDSREGGAAMFMRLPVNPRAAASEPERHGHHSLRSSLLPG